MKRNIKRTKVSCVVLVVTLILTMFSSIPVMASSVSNSSVTDAYNEDTLREAYVSYTGATVYEVEGNKFCTLTVGDSDNVIFFLPGLGLTSPIIDMKPFASALAQKGYKVIIVEPLGTGMSDITNKKRTVGNITKELHNLIKKMGYKEYSIMGHSISGAYGLYYANKYPKEVKSFISLDGSVPAQIENTLLMEAEKMNLDSIKSLIESGQDIPSEYYLSSIYGYSYTAEEKDFIKQIFINRQINTSLLNEYDELENNLNKCMDFKFPCKYLGFISEQNLIVYPAALEASSIEELMTIITDRLSSYVPSPSIRDLTQDDLANPKGWAALHLNTYDSSNSSNKTYVVPSNHYVHYSQEWPNMVNIIDNWYKQNVH